MQTLEINKNAYEALKNALSLYNLPLLAQLLLQKIDEKDDITITASSDFFEALEDAVASILLNDGIGYAEGKSYVNELGSVMEYVADQMALMD